MRARIHVPMRALVFLSLSVLLVPAQSVRLVRIANGLASPTEIATVPGDSSRLFVVEQRGRIRVLKDGALLGTPMLDLTGRVSCCGEQGLLGLAFPSKDRFYVYYTDPSGTITISRFQVSATDPDRADAASETILVRIPHPDFQNHNGGHLAFDRDGYLYAGTGDGGSAGDPRGNGQNRSAVLGKLLRLSTERDNSAIPQIWAIGLRNPWKFSFDSKTGDLYIADVGQDAVEEIDFQAAPITSGLNYGWNRMEGSQCYNPRSGCDQSGITLPVFEYSHSVGLSITGGYVYRGKSMPSLEGAYIYADYVRGQIWALRRNGSAWQNELLLSSGMQVSTFGQDSAGEVYVASYSEGAVYRIAPAAGTISAVNAASFGEGIVPGSLASLFGPGIAPVVGVLRATTLPLPTTAGNVFVTMNGIRVPLLAVASVNGQEQINLQVPWELNGQPQASLVVNVNGQALPAVNIPLAPAHPEIFAVQRGADAWTLWATGLGPVSNAPESGRAAQPTPLARTSGETRVSVAGQDLPVLYSGLAPGYVGLYQINVAPPTSSAGPVVLSVNGMSSRPFQPE